MSIFLIPIRLQMKACLQRLLERHGTWAGQCKPVAGSLNIRASMVSPTSWGTVLHLWAKAHLPYLWLVDCFDRGERGGSWRHFSCQVRLPLCSPAAKLSFVAMLFCRHFLLLSDFNCLSSLWDSLQFWMHRWHLLVSTLIMGPPAPRTISLFSDFHRFGSERWVCSVCLTGLLIHSPTINFELLIDCLLWNGHLP